MPKVDFKAIEPNPNDLTIDSFNILYIAEGFSDAQQRLFEDIAKKIDRNLFKSQEPLNIKGIRRKFNSWMAFLGSVDEGISVDFRINISEENDGKDKGKPVPPPPPYGTDEYQFPELDTAVGMFYHYNEFGKVTISEKSEKDPTELGIVKPDGTREWQFKGPGIVSLLQGLPIDQSDKDHLGLPDCWISNSDATLPRSWTGRSEGLVIVIVNDSFFHGASYNTFSTATNYCVVTVGKEERFFIISPPLPTNGSPTVEKSAWTTLSLVDFPNLTGTVAHEIGHAHFELGDEYSGNSNTDPTDLRLDHINLQRKDEVFKNGKWIVPPKWEDLIREKIQNNIETTGPLWTHDPNVRDNEATPPKAGTSIPAKIFGRRTRVIGMYEGGGTYNVDVYRPAGICKMRSHVTDGRKEPFCFVCQYFILKKIGISFSPSIDTVLFERWKKKYQKKFSHAVAWKNV